MYTLRYDSVHIIGLEMHFHQKGDLLEIFCSLQNLAVVIVRSVIILSLRIYLELKFFMCQVVLRFLYLY